MVCRIRVKITIIVAVGTVQHIVGHPWDRGNVNYSGGAVVCVPRDCRAVTLSTRVHIDRLTTEHVRHNVKETTAEISGVALQPHRSNMYNICNELRTYASVSVMDKD